jgi:hypothetical protein
MDEEAKERALTEEQLALTDDRATDCARIIAVESDGWETRTERLFESLYKGRRYGRALSLILTATIERAVREPTVDERRRGEVRVRGALLQDRLLSGALVRCPVRRLARWVAEALGNG